MPALDRREHISDALAGFTGESLKVAGRNFLGALGYSSEKQLDRELNKHDSTRDVLRKVTLIKDIRWAEPLRAHIEILNDLALDRLYDEFSFRNFVELHRAWSKKLDSSELNKQFYREVTDWYL